MSRFIIICVAALLPAALAAQADSLAGVARARFREAVAAEKRGDLVAARDRLVEAARAWPAQPAYPFAAAEMAARLGDTASVVRMLSALADLGGSADLAGYQTLVPFAKAPAMAAVVARLEANRSPLVRSDSVAGIADPEFYPEGMDYDPGSRSWFVASIRKRTVARIDRDGKVTDFPRPGTERLDAALGVRVDSRHGVVWVATRALPAMEGYQPADGARARVWAFALGTGALLGMAEAPADAPHLFGDLVVHSSGAVYLSDSESPLLYRARLEGGKVVLEKLFGHRLFRSLQGLAFDETERRLYLADYSHGLLVVDLASGSVATVATPAGVSTIGLDGIARSGNAIVGVQNGFAPPRVVRLRLSSDGNRVEALDVIDRHLPVADEPTIGAVVGDRFVYVANSQWEKYDDAGKRKPGTTLHSPVLLAVPIGR